MEQVRWSKKYALGIDSIDVQHRILVEMTASILSIVRKKSFSHENKDVLALLNNLVNYCEYHFEYEEKFFSNIDYPDKEIHLAAHRSFEKKIEEIHAKYLAGDEDMGLHLCEFLVSWLYDHILVNDATYAELYLTAKEK